MTSLRFSNDFKLIVPIQMRWRDADALGHVNNAVYLTYLEAGRLEYWKQALGIRDRRELNFILGRVQIEFRSPLQLYENVTVGVRCSDIRGASFDFECGVFGSDRRVAAVALTTQVMYNYAEGKPMRMPDDFRAKIESFERRSGS